MVVKSKVVSKHVGDLTNIFGILRKHKLRLNASKCLFRVGSGKFLGYMVNWKHKDTRMQEYLSQARRIQTKFEFFYLSYIPEMEIPMQTLWPPLPLPWHRICPE